MCFSVCYWCLKCNVYFYICHKKKKSTSQICKKGPEMKITNSCWLNVFWSTVKYRNKYWTTFAWNSPQRLIHLPFPFENMCFPTFYACTRQEMRRRGGREGEREACNKGVFEPRTLHLHGQCFKPLGHRTLTFLPLPPSGSINFSSEHLERKTSLWSFLRRLPQDDFPNITNVSFVSLFTFHYLPLQTFPLYLYWISTRMNLSLTLMCLFILYYLTFIFKLWSVMCCGWLSQVILFEMWSSGRLTNVMWN